MMKNAFILLERSFTGEMTAFNL